ncbi:hypothetical protein VNO77_02328 [Canavalia gladiata]|uniref:Uncharacterized protein n=1 Tax=Canavalia gladiata TaxID=3824 RepID=A0AAN9MTF9_CANGL
MVGERPYIVWSKKQNLVLYRVWLTFGVVVKAPFDSEHTSQPHTYVSGLNLISLLLEEASEIYFGGCFKYTSLGTKDNTKAVVDGIPQSTENCISVMNVQCLARGYLDLSTPAIYATVMHVSAQVSKDKVKSMDISCLEAVLTEQDPIHISHNIKMKKATGCSDLLTALFHEYCLTTPLDSNSFERWQCRAIGFEVLKSGSNSKFDFDALCSFVNELSANSPFFIHAGYVFPMHVIANATGIPFAAIFSRIHVHGEQDCVSLAKKSPNNGVMFCKGMP